MYEGEHGWNIRTSIIVFSRGLQIPTHDTSRRAQSVVLPLKLLLKSASIGISGGSVLTSVQTSLNILANVSLILLCLKIT